MKSCLTLVCVLKRRFRCDFNFHVTQVILTYCSICIISKSKGEIYFPQFWHMHNMQTFIGTWIQLLLGMWVFLCYYFEDFHFWFPYHTLVPSFRELSIYISIWVLTSVNRQIYGKATRRQQQSGTTHRSAFGCREGDLEEKPANLQNAAIIKNAVVQILHI